MLTFKEDNLDPYVIINVISSKINIGNIVWDPNTEKWVYYHIKNEYHLTQDDMYMILKKINSLD